MLALHAARPHVGNGTHEMGTSCKGSIETSTCAMTALLPAKPISEASCSLSESGNRHQGGEIEKEKKQEEENKDDGDKKTNVSATERTAPSAASSHDMEDMEAARQAVLVMGMPEALVQLVMDLRHVEPSLSFSSARQLYELVDDLAARPDRQAELNRMLNQHHKSRDASSNVAEHQQRQQEKKKPGDGISKIVDHGQNRPAGMPEGDGSAAVAQSPSLNSTSFSAASPAGNLPSDKAQLLSKSTDLPKAPVNIPKTSTSFSTPRKEQPPLRERVRKLAEENWRLTQRKRCRACRKVDLADSGITYLPCGHFITCEECSEKFDDCPACGKAIMGTVRTFLS